MRLISLRRAWATTLASITSAESVSVDVSAVDSGCGCGGHSVLAALEVAALGIGAGIEFMPLALWSSCARERRAQARDF